MLGLRYLTGYSDEIKNRANRLISENTLGDYILKKYPSPHSIRTDRALYEYAISIKNRYLQKSQPLNRVIYDSKINTVEQVLGMHYHISRIHGAKLKSKHEIKISSVFKTAPEEFLRMIVVHELAHLKEKDHNRAFYSLCEHMEPDYYSIELDMRLYLTLIDNGETLYGL